MFRVTLTFVLLLLHSAQANAQRHKQPQDAMADFLRQEVEAGRVVGAQILVGSGQSRGQAPVNLGFIGPEDSRPVSDKTVFCIASCSKPIASALIFTLLDRGQLQLDQPVSELIPAMSSPITVEGTRVRSPTLGELLTHRGGIYSQMDKPTKVQLAAIRDFTMSLDDSVAMIADQPLASVPGTKYAYSGAGYCLLGSMAEKATGKDIELLLQENICNPLGMTSTTYFPSASGFEEIAVGGKSNVQPPHLMGSRLKLTLVGGSLYSTAKDLERFARMVISQGRSGRKIILSKTAFSKFVSPAYPTQSYGYGWLLTKQGGRVEAVSHMGSLPPFQSAIGINGPKKTYKIVLWTLAKPVDVESTIRIRDKIATLIE